MHSANTPLSPAIRNRVVGLFIVGCLFDNKAVYEVEHQRRERVGRLNIIVDKVRTTGRRSFVLREPIQVRLSQHEGVFAGFVPDLMLPVGPATSKEELLADLGRKMESRWKSLVLSQDRLTAAEEELRYKFLRNIAGITEG